MIETDKLEMGDLIIDIFRLCNQDKPTLVKLMAHLEKGFFDSKIFMNMFSLFKVYFDKYQKAPTEKVFIAEMTKTGGFTEEAVKSLTAQIYNQKPIDSGEKQYITDLVVNHARKQKLKRTIESAWGKLDGDVNKEFSDDEFNEILNSMKDSIKFSIDTNLGVDLFDVDERYTKIANSLQDKISSGYNQIDKYTGGGFARKELVAVQAPPGIGKCEVYNSIINIEIDTEDPLYQKLKHLFEKEE